MNAEDEDQIVFEIVVAFRRRTIREDDDATDCVNVLEKKLEKVGLVIERVFGLDHDFIKLAAPLKTIGKAASELQMKKQTRIGMDLQFEWEQVDAFVKQPDGSLFSWCERFRCYCHLLYGIVNQGRSAMVLKFDGEAVSWEVGENLLQKLEAAKIVKLIFPLHDERQSKKLRKNWAMQWWGVTSQPINDIYSYYGAKIAIYFAFLGMYTKWLLFPAAFGIIMQLIDFGSLQLYVLPIFYVFVIIWASLFFQFWKRKNAAHLSRWQLSFATAAEPVYKIPGNEDTVLTPPVELIKEWETDVTKEKEFFQRHEWLCRLMRFRNDVLIIMSIVCLQLPIELAYAHLFEVIHLDIMKLGLTCIYLCIIEYFTKIGCKVSAKLVKYENIENREKRADSLVYKVFGLYFMQTYIGIFYHALVHRNFATLRKLLMQRQIVSEVLGTLLENAIPYFIYQLKKYGVRNKKKKEKGATMGKIDFPSRVEKDYLRPAYAASIVNELEDGLFNDFLELALQFGRIMMFACAFPLAFGFSALNNIMEIRTDALKLLAVYKRPVPRAAVTIGAWTNIFQFLILMSICTNAALLVWLYDQEGKWKIDPGLAAILILEHVLLLIKFGFSRFIPEEPTWVKVNRAKKASQAQNMCSRQLLRTISVGERNLAENKKMD